MMLFESKDLYFIIVNIFLMRLNRVFVKLIFVLLVLVFISNYASASCIGDIFNAEIIKKPFPIIIIEFGEVIDYSTLELSFVTFPFIDDSDLPDVANPIDKISILNPIESSDETILRHNLTEEVVHGQYYLIEVSAKTKDQFDAQGNLIKSSYKLEECKLMRADFGDLDIKIKHPSSGYITDVSERIVFETTRRSECHISLLTDRISRMTKMTKTDGYIHENIHLGSSPFYVGCVDHLSERVRTFDVILDTTPPTVPVIDDSTLTPNHPNISLSTSNVRVKFDSSDSVSGVKLINYTIIDKNTGNQMMAWTTTSNIGEHFVVTTDSAGNQIRLVNRGTYKIRAKAQNNAGLWSEYSESKGFEVYLGFNPNVDINLCDEQNINCEDGHSCAEDKNCLSGFCHPEQDICMAPSCDDGFLNGDESDVDCGGSCTGCEIGLSCSKNSDCLSEYCDLVSLSCAQRPQKEEPAEERPREQIQRPPQEEERDSILPIIISIVALVLVGGGGYLGYANKDKIMSYINTNFSSSSGSSNLNTQNKPSQSSPQTQQTSQNYQNSGSNVAAQLSRRLKSKETMRKRDDLFKGFSDTKENSGDGLSKDDIDSLFNTKK